MWLARVTSDKQTLKDTSQPYPQTNINDTMSAPQCPDTREPSPFIPAGIFPIIVLPPELKIQIASYLTPRGIFALLLSSPAFECLLYVFTTRYTREQVICKDRRLYCYTPLQYFCSRGVERVVKRMLEAGVDANEIDLRDNAHQISPLIQAVGFRSGNIVDLLLQHGARVDDVDQAQRRNLHFSTYWNTALHIAVGAPHSIPPRWDNDQEGYNRRGSEIPRIVDLLLAAGANANDLNMDRYTPLHIACATPHINPLCVRSLIAAGGDVSRITSWWEDHIQSIHFAANSGNVEVLQMLLDSGADAEAISMHGVRPLDLAVLHRRKAVVEMLVQAGANVSGKIQENGQDPEVLDPFELVTETATWEEFKAWVHARGLRWTGCTVGQWWNQGKEPGMIPLRRGQGRDMRSWLPI